MMIKMYMVKIMNIAETVETTKDVTIMVIIMVMIKRRRVKVKAIIIKEIKLVTIKNSIMRPVITKQS